MSGEQLRQARLDAGLTLRQASELLDIKASTLSSIEMQMQRPSPGTLETMNRVYGIGEKKPEDVVMPFGKHKGATLRDVLMSDPAHLDWLLTIEIPDAGLRTAIKQMNEKYAPEIERAI